MREAKALMNLRICAGSSEPLLLASAISSENLCAVPFYFSLCRCFYESCNKNCNNFFQITLALIARLSSPG